MMMSAKEAVAMSNLTIFFGCLTRYIKTFKNKHPLKDSTSIDYGIVTCMLPLVMLGTTIGVQVNDLLPDTLVYILLFVTLLYLTYSSVAKSIETYKKETEATRKEKMKLQKIETQSINDDEPNKETENQKKSTEENKEEKLFEPLMNSSKQNFRSEIERKSIARIDSKLSLAKGPEITQDDRDIDDEDKEALYGSRRSVYEEGHINKVLNALIEAEKSHFRPTSVLAVLVPFIVILLITMFRGTREFRSIIKLERCKALDFVFLGGLFLILIVHTIFNIFFLKREYRIKEENEYQFVKGDVVWNQKTITKFCIFAMIAGFISGAVGLSGGVLFTPLFLEFGIAPTVASSTSMYMAMFATLSSAILYMFAGYMIYPIAFWLSLFSTVGTYLGSTLILNAVKKSGRSSYLVFLLSFTIIISGITVAVEGIRATIRDSNDHKNLWEFNEYCYKSII